MNRVDLRAAMLDEWQSVAGRHGEKPKFTDGDVDFAINALIDFEKSPGEIFEAWKWFIRCGPDGSPRRALSAATPVNFVRFGWQAWVANQADTPEASTPRESCDVCNGLGMIFFRTLVGVDTAYRCRCANGNRKQMLPAAPDGIWFAAETRGAHVVLEEWVG